MALNIKNERVEKLAAEVAMLAGETKTEAVRRALEERQSRLQRRTPSQRGHLLRFLEREVDPYLPDDGLRHMTKEEREQILGYGADGV